MWRIFFFCHKREKSPNFEKSGKHTDLVEEKDEIHSKGDEQRQEPKVVEVARKIVLHKENTSSI